jgi:hypothetical protein
VILAAFPIVPVVVCIAIVCLCIVAVVFITYEPWWHSNPSPRRQVDDAIDQVKIVLIHKIFPWAFRTDIKPVVGEKKSEEFDTP